MKTPREILLRRRAAAEPDLDAMRRAVGRLLPGVREPWWSAAWRELVLAARPAWSLIGALGVVAAGLHLAASSAHPTPTGVGAPSRATVQAAREELHRLWAELSEGSGEAGKPVAAPAPKSTPLRRSELPSLFWRA